MERMTLGGEILSIVLAPMPDPWGNLWGKIRAIDWFKGARARWPSSPARNNG